MKRKAGELVMTIEDDDEVDQEEEEEEGDGALEKIEFGDYQEEPVLSWNFTRPDETISGHYGTTVDQKIELARRKKEEEKMAKLRKEREKKELTANAQKKKQEKLQKKKSQVEDDEEDDEEEDDEEEDEEDGGELVKEGEEEEGEEGKEEEDEDLRDLQEATDAVEDGSEVEEQEEEPDEENSDEDTIEQQKAKEFYAKAPKMPSVVSFSELNLSRPLLKAVNDLNFARPTPIQGKTIPIALLGKDVCANAVTGSGKTAAFLLPILERLIHRPKRVEASRVLILIPTRELAAQCHSMCEKLCKYTDVRCALVVGGLSNKIQEQVLRSRPDIIIATPGRMIDHLRNAQSIDLDDLEILILDEADRLLELGFKEELEELIKSCPKGRQTMLFSATMTTEVDNLVSLSLQHPVRVSVDPLFQVAQTLEQEFIRVRSGKSSDKEGILLALCTRTFKSHVIVFFRSKQAAHRMKIVFGLLGLSAAELHGNLTQVMRLEALEKFREEKVDFLLATDLASRGLDIVGIQTVINFDMPKIMSQYIHRVGRTARAGKRGRAVSLVQESDRKLLKDIVKKAKEKVKKRTVPPEAVKKWKEKVESLEGDVENILQSERNEKELRLAEMETSKAENMMRHEDEIFSKPARSWFMSEKEKKDLKEKSKKQALGDDGGKGKGKKGKNKKEKKEKKDPYKGMTRKKRRRIMFAKESEQPLEEVLKKQKMVGKKLKSLDRKNKILSLESDKKVSSPFDKNKKKEKGGKKKKGGNNNFDFDKKDSNSDKGGKGEKVFFGKKKSTNSFKSKGKFKRRK